MASNVTNRSTVRASFAALLRAGLVGTGLPVQAVWQYMRANFRGIWPVVLVSSGGSSRKKMSRDTLNRGSFLFNVDSFVLHSETPVQATNNPAAGSNIVINIPDTSLFTVGSTALILDDVSEEIITINAVVPNVSIQATTLLNSYTLPLAQSWTEANSEDTIDLIEKKIADIISDNYVNEAIGLWIEVAGDSNIDNVLVAGRVYRHEIMPVRIQVLDN